MAAKDVIKDMNANAEYFLVHNDKQGVDTKYINEYQPVKIPKEKQDAIQDEFKRINNACWPTLEKMDLIQNALDLQDRVFNRAQYYATNANTCLTDARNVAEVNYCCDQYISKLKNDFNQDVMKILREY